MKITNSYKILLPMNQHQQRSLRKKMGGSQIVGNKIPERMGFDPRDVDESWILMIASAGIVHPFPTAHREVLLLRENGLIATISMN